MSDNEELIESFGPEKSPLRVSLSSFNGSRLFNIRRFYTDKTTNELKPGKQGLALKEDEFEFFTSLLEKNRHEVEAHFVSDLTFEERQRRTSQKGKFAGIKVQMQQGEIELQLGQVGGGELFKIDPRGGKVVLTLNSDFECFRDVDEGNIPPSIIKLIGVMLMSVRYDESDDSLKSSYLLSVRNQIKANLR